jgi:hypothetical protein
MFCRQPDMAFNPRRMVLLREVSDLSLQRLAEVLIHYCRECEIKPCKSVAFAGIPRVVSSDTCLWRYERKLCEELPPELLSRPLDTIGNPKVGEVGYLCPVHDCLNARVINDILSLLKSEVTDKLAEFNARFEDGYELCTPTYDFKAFLASLKDITAFWLPWNEFVFQRPITSNIESKAVWPYDLTQCSACILSRVGSCYLSVQNLRFAIHCRDRSEDVRLRVPLLRLLEAWARDSNDGVLPRLHGDYLEKYRNAWDMGRLSLDGKTPATPLKSAFCSQQTAKPSPVHSASLDTGVLYPEIASIMSTTDSPVPGLYQPVPRVITQRNLSSKRNGWQPSTRYDPTNYVLQTANLTGPDISAPYIEYGTFSGNTYKPHNVMDRHKDTFRSDRISTRPVILGDKPASRGAFQKRKAKLRTSSLNIEEARRIPPHLRAQPVGIRHGLKAAFEVFKHSVSSSYPTRSNGNGSGYNTRSKKKLRRSNRIRKLRLSD